MLSPLPTNMKILITFLIVLFIAPAAESQILGRITERAVRKVERRIEDKLVEAISEEIARQAFRPVEQAIDSMLRQKYQDSLGREEIDWEKMAGAYADFLNGLNDAADLPENYTFDLKMDIEATDYDGKKSTSSLFFSKSTSILGVESNEHSNETQLVIIDIEKDIIILYSTDKEGRKSAQAVPSMLKFMSSLTKQESTAEDPINEVAFTKTGKTRTIAGHQTHQFAGSTEEELIEYYAAESFPVSWENSFGPYLEQFAPESFSDRNDLPEGMILASSTIQKSDSSQKSSWETTKIEEKEITIQNADYVFRALGQED